MAQLDTRPDPVVIVAARRTPIGSFQGRLSGMAAPQLGKIVISAILDRVGHDEIDEVFMGNVLGAGLGQNPARQAALGAGLDLNTPSTTVSKVCGSGMKAVMLGHDSILAGSADMVVAGGMESMSNAPYLLPNARGGLRLGHGEVKDHMFLDGLEDAYSGRVMGSFAEETASAYQISRDEQDSYAKISLDRALAASAGGAFTNEIVCVHSERQKSNIDLMADEQPGRVDRSRIPQLRPAFKEGGTVTAANSSSISDGAAALLLMRQSNAERRGLPILAEISGHATSARKPSEFTLAPADSIRMLMKRIGWETSDVDLFEINEAFAIVALVAMRDLGLGPEVVNVNGGACALGHPIGASGARIIVTLLHAMISRDAKRGVASLCIGGGEATAIALYRPSA